MGSSSAQERQYRNWSFLLGPSIYNAGKTINETGSYKLESMPIFSFSAGFEYYLINKGNNSLLTGLWIAYEPELHIDVDFKEEEFAFNILQGNTAEKSYFIPTYSIPLLFEHTFGTKKYFNGLIGLKMMYFLDGDSIHGWSYDIPEVKYFQIRNLTPKNVIQGSFVIGVGMKKRIKNSLVSLKIISVFNFQNTFKGNYWIDNLLISGPTAGEYVMSGNYTNLQISLNLPKRKRWKTIEKKNDN